MNTTRPMSALLLCCSLAALAVPGVAAAQAQDQAQPADSATTDIIVTATRQQQRLQDVAMSVNVATGEQLQKFKIFDVKDISQLAPGQR